MERALITGVLGFTGSHLAELLIREGFEVHGADLPGRGRENLSAAGTGITLHELDLGGDRERVSELVEETRPDYVFHLAGRIGGAGLEDLLQANVIGTERLLTAIGESRETKPKAVVIPGSASEYGPVDETDLPIGEDTRLRPANLYGVSKVAQAMAAEVWARLHFIPIVRTRTFNLTGPREPISLVSSSFARQIAAIKAGEKEPVIFAGPLGGERDFVDIRDAVRAYLACALTPAAGGKIYNVCSGVGVKIGSLLESLIRIAGVEVKIRPNPEFAGREDTSRFVGDGRRAKEDLGWEAEIPLEDSLRDLFEHWLERAGK